MAFGNSEPGQEHFPPPNYVNPTTRVPVVLGLTISTCGLLLVLTGARLYARSHLRNVLGIDDWMMLCAAALAVTLTAFGASSCLYGLGYHLWDRRPEWDEPYYKIGFAFQIVYPLCVGLTKISVCQTYLRIFPSTTSRYFSHSMTVFVTAYTITCVILMLTQCYPLVGYWDKDVEIHCVDMRANMITIGAINTATDFLIYLWPARYLWRIQLPLKQRLGLVFVFTCGLIVCVAGVFRMIYLQRYFTNSDLLWDAALTTSLGIVEVNIGIVCGCLPCVKPVLAKLLPSLFGSTGRTSRTTPSGEARGPSYQFKDLSAHHADKGGSTAVLREERIEEILEESESDGASTHSLTKPVVEYDARGHKGPANRDSIALPKNGIIVDRTVTVERSWVADA
ncbi:hypothetical protein DPSP01_004781 [Paraphaeosphaeria sporulosa]|uniref:Rhodopsin domain-containing protein n=1 Tax=Paraphaeosphaeria sporulosa TaxID=1460663 RepID=A0A177CNX1_9PLEO|nr:uncharacterized protein CC84DRAFT_1142093 [Paraphaeosphaeria sporulosa]OAG08986.1 hypothetical protein CC84DRAFT_1142093 [Paraphaeosphaeria sporulosa]